jgi:DNA-directed RNA polymerase alpha subunit
MTNVGPWGDGRRAHNEQVERNVAIFIARERGRTLDDIGAEHGISKERVRSIVARQERLAKRQAIRGTERDRYVVDTLTATLDSLEEKIEAARRRMEGGEDFTSVPLEDLRLSVRARNRLMQDNCSTVADILRRSEADLMRLPGFGRKTLDEINAVLTKRGFGRLKKR